jgi:two-component system LytT family sensor kinase
MSAIKKYRLLTGGVISLFIALLAFLPQMVQEKETGSSWLILVNVTTIFLYSFICWWLNMYLVTLPAKDTIWSRQWVKLVASFVVAFVISYILLYAVRNHFGQDKAFVFRQMYGRRRIVGVMVFRGAFVNAFLYFIGYILHISAQNQQAQLENERLKHENLQARLFVLKQQLSPHFLFNSLGILNTLTADAAVHKYIIQLSAIYRYLLANHEGHLATLKQEMDFINAYLYIVKERFEEALQVTITINDALLQRCVPPAALQLLIENAIKHNVVAAEEPLHITIFTQDNYIVVSNTLNPKAGNAPGEGIGLHNIAERYRLLSGTTLVIERTAGLFTVKLPLI